MIFDFLKKQKEFKQKKKLTQIMIMSLQISESQKSLYIQALEILDKQGVDNLYLELTRFVENYELKELKEISKNNYSTVAGMRKKEALEKQKDLNSFSFLINNL
ncbi:MAG: hypothetical protein PHH06_02935 [Candidatus Gracilibacteria bacterium]|nr:hypothetical protein [Candidatus Gracilibacteria bacterium]